MVIHETNLPLAGLAGSHRGQVPRVIKGLLE